MKSALFAVAAIVCTATLHAETNASPRPSAVSLIGTLPGPLPLFPATNWWNLDISAAPLDANSLAFIAFIGGLTPLHPDCGGDGVADGSETYGMPYVVVDETQPKLAVDFQTDGYPDESDGVDHNTNTSFPFYPIPAEAITMTRYVEGGAAGNVDLRGGADRHLLIVDRDNKLLYELYNVWYDGTKWLAGSGAFFDMKTNDRRPDGWTSADAAGLAILPGLLRYDEAYGTAEIGHAFRVTLRTSNGYVYPASHNAGATAGALPMGARLRLKASVDLSSYTPEVQRIFRAMKKYGLIMADNGSDMYITGTWDNNWDNGILNPAFGSLHANDFEVIQLGWNPPAVTIASVTPAFGPAAGGTAITIAGTGFAAGAAATLGGTALAGSVVTATSITGTTGAHATGHVDAVVTNPDASSGTLVRGFTYTTPTPAHGDVNADGTVDAIDVIYLVNFLFANGASPIGPGDVNNDDSVDVSDVIYLINFIFAGGPAPL
jgi:IPT/TIG domain.